ncbi:MAG: YHYH protein [Verrucomicrobiae bacterium]|nr:YHYH protein [Verrucomicrobiae bacterium]
MALTGILSWTAAQQGPPGRDRRGGPPGGFRQHTANASSPIQLVPATRQPPARSESTFQKTGASGLEVRANGIPDHRVGAFPNRGNPNSITEQGYDIVIPSDPRPAPRATSQFGPFGIALNGVMLDPGAAEYWQGDPSLGWTYEALGGAVALGIDENHAHVQPTGAYHYHGLPTLYLKQLGVGADRHSAQIGWAADGFPIYALYGYREAKNPASGIVKLQSSYRLKSGKRPTEPDGPGGTYDGAFVQDYEYVEGGGDLDECNGRFCVTPEYPEGTYAYFLTEAWPVIPRLFRGTPVPLREEGRGGGPGPGGPPGRDFGPPPGGPGGRPPFPPPPQH